MQQHFLGIHVSELCLLVCLLCHYQGKSAKATGGQGKGDKEPVIDAEPGIANQLEESAVCNNIRSSRNLAGMRDCVKELVAKTDKEIESTRENAYYKELSASDESSVVAVSNADQLAVIQDNILLSNSGHEQKGERQKTRLNRSTKRTKENEEPATQNSCQPPEALYDTKSKGPRLRGKKKITESCAEGVLIGDAEGSPVQAKTADIKPQQQCIPSKEDTECALMPDTIAIPAPALPAVVPLEDASTATKPQEKTTRNSETEIEDIQSSLNTSLSTVELLTKAPATKPQRGRAKKKIVEKEDTEPLPEISVIVVEEPLEEGSSTKPQRGRSRKNRDENEDVESSPNNTVTVAAEPLEKGSSRKQTGRPRKREAEKENLEPFLEIPVLEEPLEEGFPGKPQRRRPRKRRVENKDEEPSPETTLIVVEEPLGECFLGKPQRGRLRKKEAEHDQPMVGGQLRNNIQTDVRDSHTISDIEMAATDEDNEDVSNGVQL